MARPFRGHVDEGIFSKMKKLRHLNLSHNRLSLVSKNNSSFPTSTVILWLASCNIREFELEFLRNVPEFYTIDLSTNNIREIPSCYGQSGAKLNS
ncbi:hypothetical protein LIER_42769 [Lithospermum erythrorhizon]|uniref:Uncharacterized protein n=1 Tax=Lithospermum erythrorhizon TaxID=34254 RepID=A0AAV3NX95_LITER